MSEIDVEEMSGGGPAKLFFRFYPDGEVIKFADWEAIKRYSDDRAQTFGKWFSKDLSRVEHGKFTIQGTHVSFSFSSLFGAIKYTGEVDGDRIRFVSNTVINGRQNSWVCVFVKSSVQPNP